MTLLFYVIKIKQALFSKLICFFYQVTFFCLKYLLNKRVLFKKDILEKCAVVKILFIEKIIMSHNARILCQVFKKK